MTHVWFLKNETEKTNTKNFLLEQQSRSLIWLKIVELQSFTVKWDGITIRRTNRMTAATSWRTHLPFWCLSHVGIGIRAVGTWWWGCGGRTSAATAFSSVFPLSSRFGGHVGDGFDQAFKNLSLDLASPRRTSCGFLLLGCRRTGFHGCTTRVTVTKKAERKQSKGKLRWNFDHRKGDFIKNLERERRSRNNLENYEKEMKLENLKKDLWVMELRSPL